MPLDHAIHVIQLAYPQVYLACHTRHQRRRSSEHHLSARDSAILSHLHEATPVTSARLAAHLGVARSTLSEALKRLDELGYIETADGSARRRTGLLLSKRGVEAIRGSSVLETPRLRAVLSLASPKELRAITSGMTALANACRRLGDARPARTKRDA
jgi:DNA-binding MarR family transcriptional regulator